MTLKKLAFALAAMCCILQSSFASALIAPPATLIQACDDADAIAVANINSFAIDEVQQAELAKEKAERRVYKNNDISAFFRRIRPRGTYSVQLVHTIKGQTAPTFDVYAYHFPADVKQVVFLLKKDAQGKLQAVNDFAFIVLGDISDLSTRKAIENGKTPLESVVNLLLLSLKDDKLRARNIGFLRDIVDPKMVPALAPYLNDPSIEVRNNVLYNLSLNQQVATIPRIVEEVRKDKTGYGGESIRALERLNIPEAIPYLNPLLFEPTQYLRTTTIQTLRNLIERSYRNRKPLDRSSIPFLLLSLHDPAPHQNVSMGAFASLYQFISTNGVVDYDAFRAEPENETQKLLAWWREELSGKHLRELMPGETLVVKTIPANLNRMTREQAVAALNPLLWEMSLETRRAALASLQKRADRSSIPYLLLACEDPNFDVAFGAYQLVGTLLPQLGAPIVRKSFEAERETALKPFYAWWQDELLDKHSVEGLKRFEQDEKMRREIEKQRSTMQTPTPTPTKELSSTTPATKKNPQPLKTP